uniref:Uncharacterized protein n=1 Tax=Tanacetum cinerariifolium TaxID=118510 RepID=A0A699H547_TANCI|nr:hypothetical protein [Tanacetum cinerariifolium]
MATIIEQQVAMDEVLVPSTQRLRIERSNFRLSSDIQSKESTLQLIYDVLRRCPFFKAFLVKADHIVNLESFRDMLHICPRIPGQSSDELPFEEEILDFIRFLGHSATIRTLTDVNINKLYQPWRSFTAIINKCLTRKSSGYDSFRLSQSQILWGLYHKRNTDYDFLIWEDFVYQVEYKNHKKSNEMYYPRFTKVIIHHFMSKDPSIPRRNKVNWHYVRDDFLFSTIKAYKEYHAFATREAAPKPKASARRKRSGSDTFITPPTVAVTLKLTAAAKGKQPAKATKAKSPSALLEVARTEAQQPKIVLKRSRQQTHSSQPGGSGTDEGTGSKPGVPDVPTDESEEELLGNSFDDEGADDQEKVGDDDKGDEGNDREEGEEDDDEEDKDGDKRDDNDEDQEVAKNDDKDDIKESGDDDEEGSSDEEDDNEETRDDESFDPIPQTLKSIEDEGDGEEDQGLNIGEEERHDEEEEEDKLYQDVNINQGRGLQASLETEDSHVTLIPIKHDGQQESSSVLKSLEENFSKVMQTNQFAGVVSSILRIFQHFMDQRMNEAVQVAKIIKEQVKDQVKAQVSKILPRIEQVMNEQLEAEVLTRSSHSSRTSYAVAADLSEMELKKILIEKIEGYKSIQCSDEQRNLYKALVDAYESGKIILKTYEESVTLKRRRDDDEDKDEEPSAGPDRGSKRRIEGKEPESASTLSETATKSASRSTTGSRSRQASASKSAFAEEPVQTTSQMEEPSHPEFETGADDQPIVQSSQHPEWLSQPQKPPTSDRDWNKTLPAVHESIQPWISELAKQADYRSSFNELLDTPLDFSNFIINRLRVDTLTPELLAGPTYELMKGSCKSLVELEYHLEEVYKATTDQFDWVNPEGQQYLHNLLQPLPLIPDNLGRRVILFAHFINNDLEYLQGGASSRKYTTSVTKTKAADYEHIKWIEYLVPSTMWIQEPIDYDKHALWGVSHWEREQLKIVEWHSYKHLDWITIRRDDDKLYNFKEGDLKRLRLQDIEDMLLLFVQGKLSNLTVEERFAFNVSLRLFTKSIVIQRRVEDLQLGVESYQKRLNLTKLDTYWSDLKQREAYTAYSNPRGFIYQNKDKKNRLMRIDELHKFNDGTLNDVRTALDDRLKGIRMRFLPQTIWRKSDKDRAAVMI